MTSEVVLAEALVLLEQAASLMATVEWGSVATAKKLEAALRMPVAEATLDAAKVALAGDLAQGKQVETAGWASAKDFLTAVTGGPKGAGPALVRLAARLDQLPAVAEAFRSGRLSMAKAEVIAAKVAELPRDESLRSHAAALLIERAAVLDASDLARAWGDVLNRLDPEGTILGPILELHRQEDVAHRERRGSFGRTRGGGSWFKVQSTDEDIALVKETLMPYAAPVASEPGACGGSQTGATHQERRGTCFDVDCNHDGRDTRDHGARMADALFDACRRLQSADVLPESHGAAPRLVVTTDVDSLRDGVTRHYGGLLPDGDRLSVAALRRLACDAEVIPVVLGGESQVLDVGRAKRLVTPAMWTALVFRDRHCAFPGCRRQPIACDAHHLVAWADGGRTRLSNLVMICRKHHALLHTTPWVARINPADGRPEFRPPPGRDGPRGWIRERPPHLLVA